MPDSAQEAVLDASSRSGAPERLPSSLGPSVADRPGVMEWWGRVERFAGTPRTALAKAGRSTISTSGTCSLSSLYRRSSSTAATTCTSASATAAISPSTSQARGSWSSTAPTTGRFAEPDLLGAIEEFVTGERREIRDTDRVLATVLFMDVVGSTERASELGDVGWRRALDLFEASVRDGLALFARGADDTAGDGFLATFDGPARAIRCAWHIREALARNGLEVGVGLHTGEVTKRGDDVSGIAVHIGARVSAIAEPGEVLVTRTVRDLVAGSGISFEERGEHELKGVPDRWALYAAVG